MYYEEDQKEKAYPNTTSKKSQYRRTFNHFKRHLSNEEPNQYDKQSDQDEARLGFFGEENSVFYQDQRGFEGGSNQNFSHSSINKPGSQIKKQKSENHEEDADLLIKFKAIESEFLGHIKESGSKNNFSSPLTSNSTTTSLVSSVKVRPETKQFYIKLEEIIEINDQLKNKVELLEIKKIIYKDLDELIADEDEVDIGRLIGKGASSEVFFGNFRFCPCAVKKINLDIINPKQLNFILNELSCLKKLRHPNIVMIIGVIITKEHDLLIITELCEQQTIKKFIDKFKGKAPKNVKLRIIFDIAKAIYYMHQNKPQIIHRDLKPENIFLTADLKAKIGDFGIARINELQENYNVNTETVATIQYMAPEAMRNGIYTTKGDIYSFAIISYEILYEELAFKGLDGFDLINSIVNKNLRPEIDQEFGIDIMKLLDSCWHKDPNMRPEAEYICKKMMKILKRIRKRN